MEIETHIPITYSHGFRGFGHWDRCREMYPPMDFWARDDRELHRWSCRQRTRAGTPVIIPEALQHGFGNMHLDDWVPPYELIGPISERDKQRLQRLMANDKDNWTQVKAPVGVKNVFEVKLNVSDFQPHEIMVKVCYGFVTIVGQCQDEDEDSDTTRHFKRTFMLPHGVKEDQLHCKLTEDGHLILCAPITGSHLQEFEQYTDADAARLSTTSCKEQELWTMAIQKRMNHAQHHA